MNQPADIRRFLMSFFNDEELDTLCFDHFPAVRANFTVGMTKEQRVKLLVDYCHHHGQFQALSDALARERPEQWSGRWTATPGAPGPRIFISYAHADAKLFVDRLEADLRQRGFIVWRDLSDMPSDGHEMSSEQCYAIDTCDRFVPVVGPAAFDRLAVQQEWAYARRKCTAITAVWRLGDGMPEDFGRYRYFDFREDQPGYDYTATLAALADKLRQVAQPGEIRGDWREPPDTAIPRKELAQLAGLLRDVPAMSVTGRAAVGAVHAPGGLGKTVLAGLFSRDCRTRWHFRDGILWVEVGRLPGVTELQLRLGRLLGDTEPDAAGNYRTPAEGRDRLAELLGRKWVLIVLDDVWDHSHVRDLIVPADNCRWLITTRMVTLGTALGLAPERVIPLDYLSDEEGLALIAAVLGWMGSDPHPEQAAHREIMSELGGHAQAVAVAAAMLRPAGTLTPARWLERFRTKKERGNPLSEVAAVQLSFEVSYEELGDADRRRFRGLGAFAPEGSFGVEAAMAIFEDDQEAAEDGLARLVARSLLSRAGDGRYSQHALLRAYALALLRVAEGEAAARGRHFGYYAGAYSDHERNRASEDRTWHNQIGADFDNIQYALEWGLAEEPGVACRLIDALEDTYVAYRQPAETRQKLLAQAKDAAIRAGNRHVEANTIKALGDVHLRLAEYDQARARYEEARPVYAGIGARLGEANTLKALGDVHLQLDEYEAARARYEEARPIYAGIGARLGEANTIQALGDVHRMLAEYDQARARYEEARPVYAGIGDRLGEANTIKALGDVHLMLAEYDQARARYEEARPVYAGIGDRLGEANTIKALGEVHLRLAEYDQARARYEEARPVYAGIGARLGEANTIQALGDVHLQLAEYDQARARYEEARPIYAGIGARLGEANTIQALGDVHLQLAEYDQARARYEEARPVYAGIGERLGEANTLKALGDVHYMLDEYEAARGRYEAARLIYAGIGDRLGEANTIRALGDVHLRLAEYDQARARYEEARPIYAGIGARLGEANTLQALGDVHYMLDEYEAARGRYEEARPIYQAIGDRTGLANILFNLGQTEWLAGDLPGAEPPLAEAVTLASQFAPGHPVTQYFTEQLAALRAELSAAHPPPAAQD